MNVTGSTLGEVVSMEPEELLANRQVIGAWNRKRNEEARKGSKGP